MTTTPSPEKPPKLGALTTELTLAGFAGMAIFELTQAAIAAEMEWAVVAALLSLAAIAVGYLWSRTRTKEGKQPKPLKFEPKPLKFELQTGVLTSSPYPAGDAPPSQPPSSGRVGLGPILAVLGACLLGLMACAALLEPVEGAPVREDPPVEIPLGGEDAEEGTLTVEGSGGDEPRPTTQADQVVDAVALTAGGLTGNPFLWQLGAQAGHALIGFFYRRKRGEG